MKKINLQIIILLGLSSCTILGFNKETIVFANINENVELNNKLFLHKDGTFLYEVQISSIKANSEGYWERKGNEIELKSLDKYKRGIMRVNESIIDMKSIQVKVIDSKNIPLETAIVELNGNTDGIGVTNEEGITLFENQKIKSININFLRRKLCL